MNDYLQLSLPHNPNRRLGPDGRLSLPHLTGEEETYEFTLLLFRPDGSTFEWSESGEPPEPDYTATLAIRSPSGEIIDLTTEPGETNELLVTLETGNTFIDPDTGIGESVMQLKLLSETRVLLSPLVPVRFVAQISDLPEGVTSL